MKVSPLGLSLMMVAIVGIPSLSAQSPTPQTQPDEQTETRSSETGLNRGRGFRGGFGRGRGRGFGPRAGRGPASEPAGQPPTASGDHGPAGHAHDDRHDEDRDVFHFLLTNHEKIVRKVKQLPNGVETLTESDDPEVASQIKEHVEWMEYRVKNTHPIRMRDPLFAELFRHTDKIKMMHEDTEKGVRVTETSSDPYVARLIKKHAEVVSGFVARGFDEAMKNHPVPKQEAEEKQDRKYPVISSHGGVIPMPRAAGQPRQGTKLVVDVTAGGDPDTINPAIEKVAKYLNIFAGAGAESVEPTIAVVFHGEATLTVLNTDAYASRFATEGNPNLELLHQFHEAGVDLYVCGQSLVSKGASPDEVAIFVEPAVSAMTAVVNLQSDGHAYLPLGN